MKLKSGRSGKIPIEGNSVTSMDNVRTQVGAPDPNHLATVLNMQGGKYHTMTIVAILFEWQIVFCAVRCPLDAHVWVFAKGIGANTSFNTLGILDSYCSANRNPRFRYRAGILPTSMHRSPEQ